MIHFPPIQTTRLLLRELTIEDAPAIFRHFSDADVTRFMDIEPCQSLQEAKEIIQFHLDDSGCRYGLFSLMTGELVGTCGYHCWVADTDGARAEIGFDLSSKHWGQGYMQEALGEVVKIGFKLMNLDYIEATVETANSQCQKLLSKLNFEREEQLRDGLYYYKLNR
ncbi:GNAT family N-acetyltransferase [Paenibacillus kobensis]|uniref:GNAT family N-acetyltransferase n=1 Tax=Paenibacillus kobensis TaxID=59841 RepID=UPI000FDBBB64|nr:GNAT family N-acetyltransferase [Paenibacillus kobensis]